MQSSVHSPYPASPVPPPPSSPYHHLPQSSSHPPPKPSNPSTPNRDYAPQPPYSYPLPSSSLPSSVPPASQRPRAPSFDGRPLPPTSSYPSPYPSYPPSNPSLPSHDPSPSSSTPTPPPSQAPSASQQLMQSIYDDLCHELLLDLCFAVHRQEKTATFGLRDPTGLEGGDVDVFGQVIKKLPDVVFKCELCHRAIGSGKFAAHLDKCMGKGRHGSRAARRKPVDYTETPDEAPGLTRGYSGGGANGHRPRASTPPMAPPRYPPPYPSSPSKPLPPPFYPSPPVSVIPPSYGGDSPSWGGNMGGDSPYTPTQGSYPQQPYLPSGRGEYMQGMPSMPSQPYAPPAPLTPTQGVKRRLSPPAQASPPPPKRPPSRSGRLMSPSSASDWWVDALPLQLPHHINTGGYPFLLYPQSVGMAAVPTGQQVQGLLEAVCGVVIGGTLEGKMCCNKRDGCQQHGGEEKAEVRRKVGTGEMEVRIRRVQKGAKAKGGK